MDPTYPSFSIADLASQIESLRALARGLVGDEQLAEDIVQEASLIALERPPRNARALAGWLRRTVTRRAQNALRSRARRNDHEGHAVQDAVSLDPADIALQVELQENLLREVRELPESYRNVVWLRYWEQLRLSEIAARLELPPETVKTRLRRGHERLRERMDARSGERKNWALALAAFAHGGGERRVPLSTPQVFAGAGTALLVGTLGIVASVGLFVLGDGGQPAELELEDISSPLVESNAGPVVGERAERSAQRIAASETPDREARRSTLDVQVRWPSSEVAADVQVILVTNHDDPDRKARRAGTDEHGRVRFEGLDPGSYRVELFRGGGEEVELVAGMDGELELTLREGVDVEGRVVDSRGDPVAGAEVWMSAGHAGWRAGRVGALSGRDGSFLLSNVNPRHGVLARAPGSIPSVVHEVSDFGRLSGKSHTYTCTLELGGPGGAVAGVLRDVVGDGIADATLAFHSPLWRPSEGELTRPAPARVIRSRSNGAFHVEDLPPGATDVSVLAEGCALWTGRVEVARGATRELDIELSTGFVFEGTVVDGRGEPQADVSIQLSPENADPSARPAFRLPRARTELDGRFRFEHLPLRDVVARFFVRDRPELGQKKRKLVGTPGKIHSERIELSLEGTLHGRVVDETGQPFVDFLVGASTVGASTVGASTLQGARAMQFTDVEGRFYLGPFEEPAELLIHPRLGFGTLARRTMLSVGDSPLEVVIPSRKRPTAGLRGNLAESDAAEWDTEVGTQEFLVEAEEFERRAGFARRVQRGEFAFDNMVPGKYRLRVSSGDRVLFIGEWFELLPREIRHLDPIALSPGVRLQIETNGVELGEPIDLHVALKDIERRLFHYERGTTTTCRLERLLPGSYSLEIHATGFVSHFEELDIETDGIHPVELLRGRATRLALSTTPTDGSWFELTVRDALGLTRYHATHSRTESQAIELYLRPGIHTFEVSSDAGQLASGSLTVPRVEGGPLELVCDWTRKPTSSHPRHER